MHEVTLKAFFPLNYAFFLNLLFLAGCSQDFQAKSREGTVVPELQTLESEAASPSQGSPEPEYIDPLADDQTRKNFGGEVGAGLGLEEKIQVIDVQQRRSTVGVSEPIQFLFLVDSSFTMASSISKLSNSLDAFYERLANAKIPHQTRLLTFDALTTQLKSQEGYYFPAGLYGLAQGSQVAKEEAFAALYQSAPRFSGTDDFRTPLDTLAQLIENPNRSFSGGICASNPGFCLNNETGVCLAMDYLSWAKKADSTAGGPGFTLGDSIHIVSLSDEDNKRDVSLISQATGQVIEGSTQPLFCAAGKGANCGRKYDELRRWTEYIYEKKTYDYKLNYRQYLCEKEDTPVVRFEGANTCERIKDFTCNVEVQKTSYTCKAGTGPESTTDNTKAGYSRCEVANSFLCDVYLDNNALQMNVPKTRAEAEIIMNQGGICRVDTTKTYSFRDISSTNSSNAGYVSKFGVRNCSAYSCQVNQFTVNQTQIKATDLGGCMPNIEKNNFMYHNFNDRIKSVTFGCNAGWNVVALDKKLNFGKNWCINSLDPAVFNGSFSKVGDTKNGLTILAGERNFSENFKVVKYDTLVGSERVLEDHSFMYPQVLASDQSALSKPETKSESIRSLSPRPDLLALGYTERVVVVPSSCVSERSDCISQNGKNFLVRGAAADNPPSSSDQEYSQKVEVMKFYTQSGRSTDSSACESGIENLYLRPTPENFRAFVQREYPQTKVTWHTIGLTEGSKNCAGKSGDFLAKDYINISRETPGAIVQNICAPDFNSFFEQLALRLESEVVTLYDLIDQSKPLFEIISVRSNSRGELEKDKDFTILSSGQIKFLGAFAAELSPGDQVSVKYKVAQEP